MGSLFTIFNYLALLLLILALDGRREARSFIQYKNVSNFHGVSFPLSSKEGIKTFLGWFPGKLIEIGHLFSSADSG